MGTEKQNTLKAKGERGDNHEDTEKTAEGMGMTMLSMQGLSQRGR